jgi:hypothetical protein
MSHRFSFLLPLALLLAGCTASPISRIDRDRSTYESWPLEVQEAVVAGRAEKGMTRAQVEMALGKPTEIVARGGPGDDEVWVYRKGGALGSGLLSNTNVSLGGSVGGVGVGTGMGGGRSRPVSEDREVVFVNGVVSRADAK